jgi:hypothetical protein
MLRPTEEVYLMLEPEKCIRHRTEFSALFGCPKCEEEEERKRKAARISGRARFYGVSHVPMPSETHSDGQYDFDVEPSPKQRPWQWGMMLLFLFVLAYAVVMNWGLNWNNRRLDAELGRIEREAR